MSQPTFCRKVVIRNTMGFHLRPIERFTKIASEYDECEVSVSKMDTSGEVANGKSFLSLVGLAAAQGTELEIEVTGPRGDELLERLVAWVDNKFGEEE
jgi:phosphocarrier protein HPr